MQVLDPAVPGAVRYVHSIPNFVIHPSDGLVVCATHPRTSQGVPGSPFRQ